jgi:CHAT domain-containing protein/Tfp pilus assembly protein PilF
VSDIRLSEQFAFLTILGLLCAPGAQAQDPPKAADLVVDGNRLADDSQYDKAIAAFESALRITRENKDQNGEADALYGIAYVYEQRGEYDRARRALNDCLAIRKQLNQPAKIGATLNDLGNVELAKGAHQEALRFYREALPQYEQGGDRGGVAIALSNIGATFRLLGDYQEGLVYLEKSEKEFEALGRDRNSAVTLGNIAQAYAYLGDYSRALEYDARALALSQKLGNRELISKSYNFDGVIENWRGNYRPALALLEKALAIRQEVKLPWGVAETLENIGEVYQSQGDHKQAIEYFSRSIEMARKIQNQSLECDGHRNRGTELLARHRPSDAMKEFDLAYKLADVTSEKVNMSISLAQMGRAQLQLGNPAEAIHFLDRAAEIQTAIGDRRDLADTKAELAEFRRQGGHTQEALAIAREAEEVASAVDRPDALWRAQLTEGKALRNLAMNSEATAALDRAIETIETLHSHVAGPPTADTAYFADKQEPYLQRMELALATHDSAGALMFEERSRARSLAQILEKGRVNVRKSLTGQERQHERELENQLASLNILASQTAEKSSPEEAAAARNKRDLKRGEWESFRTELYTAHPELAAQRGESRVMGQAEARRLAARTHALVLDYAVTARVTYLFVLAPGSIRVIPIRVSAARLKSLAGEFHRQLASQDLGFSTLAQQLYQLLLAPVETELKQQTGLIVLPDGPLWDVPFQALEPRPKHFLIEDTAISYSPSLTVLEETIHASRDEKSRPLELLALGNPANSAEKLPEAERQVRELQKLYGENRSHVLTGPAATEEAFKTEAGKYRVVHIASHAILDDASPMYSHILLAKAGTSAEDGILEAREVMDLDLDADMVVLSACDTARGEAVAGEGITGLLWAMFLGGSHTTVASLWRIESSSTSELMVEFHRHWLENRSSAGAMAKASAMRAAARKLIASERYSHPFYWAGFIVAGSPQ